MYNLHYNYIVFNNRESILKFNKDAYFAICLMDLYNIDGIENVYAPLYHKPYILRLLFHLHNWTKINHIINLPLKSLWYPYYTKNNFKEKKPLCFVFGNRLSLDYWAYVKKNYPDCKIVMLHRDLRKLTEIHNPDFLDSPLIDMQMSIDAIEAKKYGMVHFHEFESKIDVPISSKYPLSDVFFAGRAKDRLPRLLKAYDIFTKAGLKVFYYLMNVPKKDRVKLPGIVYSNKQMTYSEMLYQTVNTRCVLEINQVEAIGFTSRFLEAVMFNKRLITDNKAVIKSKFYNSQNIQLINDVNNIDPSFISKSTVVDYQYTNEFSPIHLIEQIDRELVKRSIK